MLVNHVDDREKREKPEEEEEKEIARIRAQRLKQLKSFISSDGNLECINNENELVHMIGVANCLVIFFTKASFRRCQIMREHLTIIAKEHEHTKFVSIEAEMAPFLVAKFKIKVLPCLIFISEGLLIHKLVGFEGLVGDDDFSTDALRELLLHHGMITSNNDNDNNSDSDNDNDN